MVQRTTSSIILRKHPVYAVIQNIIKFECCFFFVHYLQFVHSWVSQNSWIIQKWVYKIKIHSVKYFVYNSSMVEVEVVKNIKYYFCFGFLNYAFAHNAKLMVGSIFSFLGFFAPCLDFFKTTS